MGMNLAEAKQEAKRPPLRTALVKLIAATAWLAALLVTERVFHQGTIVAAATFLIFGTYIAWYLLRYWHSMGWLSLPKRKRSY